MPAIGTNEPPTAPRYLEDCAVGDVTETGELTITRDMIRYMTVLSRRSAVDHSWAMHRGRA
jgi:hypothetical protein